MAPGGPFDSLLQMLGQVPQQAIQPVVPYIRNVGNSATASNLGLTPSNTAQAIKLACWLAYSVVVLVQTSSTVWDIPASDLVDGSSATAAPSSSDSPCPTGILLLDCDYENCDGDPVTNLCAGTTTGQWKNCPCNSPDPPAYAPYDSVADLQQALNTLWSFVPTQYNPNAPIPNKNIPGLGIYRVQFSQWAASGGLFT